MPCEWDSIEQSAGAGLLMREKARGLCRYDTASIRREENDMKTHHHYWLGMLLTLAAVGAVADTLDRSHPPPSDPIPLGRDQASHETPSGARVGNNAAPDLSPGVDTGSRMPIPNDRNGMVDGTPGSETPDASSSEESSKED